MRYSADELYYENVVVLGYRALFTNERIRRDTVPVGWYLYEVRHDDECLFFVKYFSLKKASEFPFFSKGFSLPSAGIMHPCA